MFVESAQIHPARAGSRAAAIRVRTGLHARGFPEREADSWWQTVGGRPNTVDRQLL